MNQAKHGLRHALIGATLLAFAAEHPSAQATSLAKQRLVTVDGKSYLVTSRLKAILIGTFSYGFSHSAGTFNLDSTLRRIGNAEGWIVDEIKTGRQVTSEKLADYQVFFGNYINNWSNTGFPVAGRAAMQDFVENKGNGLFLMHPGEGSESAGWPWYQDSVLVYHYKSEAGRNVASTGKVGLFKGYQGNPSAEGHPILEGINWDGGDSTIWQDNALHYFEKPILDPSITPAHWQGLLSLNAATCGTPNTCGIDYNYASKGGNWPLSWTFPVKKGWIGYFAEGHDLETMVSMTQPVWDRFFKQFLYYIAGYDTVEVATAIHPPGSGKEGDVTYALDRSGITFHPGTVPGVLVTLPGSHIVALYDFSGRKLREIRGGTAPADYDFGPDVAGKSGVYILRVTASALTRSQRYAF